MADNNQQFDKPPLPAQLPAQQEFNVILDVLLVPLRADISNQKLPPRRRWRGGCLLVLTDPDLVPVNPNPNDGPEGFCDRGENGLFITVKNQGNADAPASVTRVTFSPFSPDVSFDLPTDPILAGGSIRLGPLEIPEVCFESGGGNSCDFQIEVDANNQVVESNEENSTASGRCSRGVE